MLTIDAAAAAPPPRHRRATAAPPPLATLPLRRLKSWLASLPAWRRRRPSFRRLLLPCADCERDGSNPAVHGPRLRADCAVCECSSRNGLSLRIAAHSMVAVRLVRSSAASLAADSPAWQLDGAHTSHTNAAAALPSSDATTTAEPPSHSLAARQALRRRPRVAGRSHLAHSLNLCYIVFLSMHRGDGCSLRLLFFHRRPFSRPSQSARALSEPCGHGPYISHMPTCTSRIGRVSGRKRNYSAFGPK